MDSWACKYCHPVAPPTTQAEHLSFPGRKEDVRAGRICRQCECLVRDLEARVECAEDAFKVMREELSQMLSRITGLEGTCQESCQKEVSMQIRIADLERARNDDLEEKRCMQAQITDLERALSHDRTELLQELHRQESELRYLRYAAARNGDYARRDDEDYAAHELPEVSVSLVRDTVPATLLA